MENGFLLVLDIASHLADNWQKVWKRSQLLQEMILFKISFFHTFQVSPDVDCYT